MTWRLYEVVLRLRSPMHIGCGKVGNMQRTRGYVVGRVFWGALTQRLTRDQMRGVGPAVDSGPYHEMGKRVHNSLAYTYFYPALKTDNGADYGVAWPWQERFSARFLGSYVSTALAYPNQCADEGTLHEVEFISPYTTDTGEPVFLKGYVFETDNAPEWQKALGRIQLGAERCYGWGRVEPVEPVKVAECSPTSHIFGGVARMNLNNDRPIVSIDVTSGASKALLAHALTEGLEASGTIEPLVGREWRSCRTQNRYAGQHVEFSGVCFQPGSHILESGQFEIGKFGVWKKVNNNAAQNILLQ